MKCLQSPEYLLEFSTLSFKSNNDFVQIVLRYPNYINKQINSFSAAMIPLFFRFELIKRYNNILFRTGCTAKDL